MDELMEPAGKDIQVTLAAPRGTLADNLWFRATGTVQRFIVHIGANFYQRISVCSPADQWVAPLTGASSVAA